MTMSASSVTVGRCIDILNAAYDPAWAEDWDAVGLVSGDRAAEVDRVQLRRRPDPWTWPKKQSPPARSCSSPITRFSCEGCTGSAEAGEGGRVIATLVRGGCALFTAHTNADVARPGVSDALAAVIGLGDTVPVQPLASSLQPWPELDKLVVFVPTGDRQRVLEALAEAGAGGIGRYEKCAWWTSGTGTFRPLEGADPAIGTVGRVEEVAEDRLEMILPRSLRRDVIAALRTSHPYEEPAFDLLELATLPGPETRARGLGRVGRLEQPLPLEAFVEHVVQVLPSTAWGVRATGDPARLVQTIAVCGGSGGELAGSAAALGAEVLLTADCASPPHARQRRRTRDRDRRRGALGHRASLAPTGRGCPHKRSDRYGKDQNHSVRSRDRPMAGSFLLTADLQS